MNEQSLISELKGIGPKTEQLFIKAGVRNIHDLLQYYPRGYDIYEKPVSIQEVQEGKMAAVSGIIYGAAKTGGSQRLQVTTITLKDLTGTIKAVWFRMPYLRNTLKSGMKVTLRGKAVSRKGSLILEQPEIFLPAESYEEKQNTMQPVYPLTAGLSNHTVMKAVRQALSYLDLTQDFLPEQVRLEYHLAEYNYAVQGIHFPLDKESFYFARERLVFEEFLVFILALRQLKQKEERAENGFRIQPKEQIGQFIDSLPYTLTNAQKKVWQEIQMDLTGPYMMSRLVQGDVGSG
ncbi:MAG TPA: ATP-dependent DNA helicase RecG, partial [Lachnospiraceae bacterium]|nr:ATP-dependent DNA helicase RecG [Lachnospiraceae bacterium]